MGPFPEVPFSSFFFLLLKKTASLNNAAVEIGAPELSQSQVDDSKYIPLFSYPKA